LDNYSVYANEELESWTERSGLLEQEAYLIEKYIQDDSRLIEAGTGGGRISLEIDKVFKDVNIVAFDFVADMIRSAKMKSDKIDFRVLDASDLSVFEDESFEFAIYLQQIVSLVPGSLVSKVLEEAYRILKKDGVIIFSFLYYEGRRINPLLSFLVNGVRFLRGEERNRQCLPWLKLGGRANLKLFSKDQATTYWFEENEAREVLEKIGFQILEVKKDNMLYVVCRK
jgi:ubiquinone/menaquinone biosynthesis C-methylase UbiE